MPLDLIAVGDVMLDGALPAPVAGGRVHGRIELRAGGSAANAALAAARLGARAAVIGRVGVDAAGRLVADTLAAAGVEPLLARDPEARTGCVVVIGGTSVVADPGASVRLAPDDLPPTLEARAVLVSGYSLLQAGPEAAARAALERSRTDWLAVDAGSARLVAAFGVDRFLEATAMAGVLLANAEEARMLTGLEGGSGCADAGAAVSRRLRQARSRRRDRRVRRRRRAGRGATCRSGRHTRRWRRVRRRVPPLPVARSGSRLGAPRRLRHGDGSAA